MKKIIKWKNINIVRDPFMIDKRELYTNRLLIIWRIMADCHIWTELSEEYIKTHDELKEYHKKIIEEYEQVNKPKWIKLDNIEDEINKRTRN